VRYVLYFGGVLAAGRWWRATARDRKERFSLFPVFAGLFWSSLLLFLWPWQTGTAAGGIIPVVVAVVAAQAVSPWTPPVAASQPKKLRLRGI
jgi:eukaryotic-like serine/threonine-protein kinase